MRCLRPRRRRRRWCRAHRARHAAQTLYVVPEIKQRIRLAWASYEQQYGWFKFELCSNYNYFQTAPFTLKVRMLNTEAIETLPCEGHDLWTLGQEHFAELRRAHQHLLAQIIVFRRRRRTDHAVSYAQAPKKPQNEGVHAPSTLRGSRRTASGQWGPIRHR